MSAFRPTCPRCCYRCDPRSIYCCECGARLGFTVEQLREIRYEASVGRMNAPQASDSLLTDDRGSETATLRRSSSGRSRASLGRPEGHVGQISKGQAAHNG